jgi:hypothetical protein
MANPTNPFNWQMPTSTDLVTDLPADFEVFGQAVATSMADLLGGTTGQVLAKASNTDMDFSWVAQDDSNAIQNTIVDAKGDLIGATAADTPARLAVGTNGQVLTADSTAATGLKWASSSAPTNVGLVCVKARTTFSGVTFITCDGVFTSTYKNYLIMADYTSTAGAVLPLVLRVGGVNASGNNYSYQALQVNGTSVSAARTVNNTAIEVGSSNGSDSSSTIITLFNPQVSAGTNIEASYNYSGGNYQTPLFSEIKGNHSVATSYDGFALSIGSGTFTGSYTVYGYGVTV